VVVVVDIVEEEVVVADALADVHLISSEHFWIKTRDSLDLMMAEQPKLLEIKTTATHTDGTTTLVMTVATAATQICTMRSQQQQPTPKMNATCTSDSPNKSGGVGSMMKRPMI